MPLVGRKFLTRYQTPSIFAGGAAAWTPASLPGLLAWYKADTGVTGTNPITAVADQSGNGNNLGNSGTVVLNSTGYNSLPAFQFTAANAAALFKSSFALGTGQAGYAFAIGQMSNSTANYGGLVCYGLAGSDDYSAGGAGVFIGRNATSDAILPTRNASGTSENMTSGANHRFGVVFDPTGTLVQPYVDNVAGTSPNSWGGTSFTSNGTLVIGNRWSAGAIGGGAWEGVIAEIVVGNGLPSTSDLNSLDAYFTGRLGA